MRVNNVDKLKVPLKLERETMNAWLKCGKEQRYTKRFESLNREYEKMFQRKFNPDNIRYGTMCALYNIICSL